MSEKRFVIGDDNIAMFEVIDMEKEELVCECRAIDVETLVNLLNSLAEENEQLRKYNGQLKERLERINGGYGHLIHRNGLTANEWLIESQERELQKKNEQISDWIERHSKDIEKISEQQNTISQLKEENEQLRKELDNFKPVMFQDMQKTVILYSKGDV